MFPPNPVILVKFPSNPVILVKPPPKSVTFPLNTVALFPLVIVKFVMQASVPFVLQLVAAGSSGPVIRLDTGRSALVAPKNMTVTKNVLLYPMYFGMNGNTINWRDERDGNQ